MKKFPIVLGLLTLGLVYWLGEDEVDVADDDESDLDEVEGLIDDDT